MNKIQLAHAIKEHPPLAEAWADRTLLAAERKKKSKTKPARSQRGAARQRTARRTNRSTTRSTLRAQAMRRDGHECAIFACGERHRLDMHHIIRREELGCVVILCKPHHSDGPESVHAGNVQTLNMLRIHCRAHDMDEAAEALDHRVEKIEEAQRAQHPEARR